MKLLRRIGAILGALLLAVVFAAVSILCVRISPEIGAYGYNCGADGNQPCYKPRPCAGFPIPYLFDTPGVSREYAVALGEDELRPGAFALDVAIYGATLLALGTLWQRHRKRRALSPVLP